MQQEEDALFDGLAEDGFDGFAVELDLLGVAAADLVGGGVAVGLVVEQDEAAVVSSKRTSMTPWMKIFSALSL